MAALFRGVSKGTWWTEAASRSQAATCTNSTWKGNYLHYCWQDTTSADRYECRAVFSRNHASRNTEKCQKCCKMWILLEKKSGSWTQFVNLMDLSSYMWGFNCPLTDLSSVLSSNTRNRRLVRLFSLFWAVYSELAVCSQDSINSYWWGIKANELANGGWWHIANTEITFLHNYFATDINY